MQPVRCKGRDEVRVGCILNDIHPCLCHRVPAAFISVVKANPDLFRISRYCSSCCRNQQILCTRKRKSFYGYACSSFWDEMEADCQFQGNISQLLNFSTSRCFCMRDRVFFLQDQLFSASLLSTCPELFSG